MGALLQFKPRITDELDVSGKSSDEAIVKPNIRESPEIEDYHQENISINDLYPLRHELNPSLASALQLLSESIVFVDDAIMFLSEDDLLSSDDAVQRFQALLPELFCCRDLGDGFGSIINSTYHALKNNAGSPLSDRQLRAIRNILKRINSEPFIDFNEAVDEIILLENVGFEVEPPHYKIAADILSE